MLSSMFRCFCCHKTPNDGVTLYRINAKGGAGIWSCRKHMAQTDAPPIDPAIDQIVAVIQGRGKR